MTVPAAETPWMPPVLRLCDAISRLDPMPLLTEMDREGLSVKGPMEVLQDRLFRLALRRMYPWQDIRWDPEIDERGNARPFTAAEWLKQKAAEEADDSDDSTESIDQTQSSWSSDESDELDPSQPPSLLEYHGQSPKSVRPFRKTHRKKRVKGACLRCHDPYHWADKCPYRTCYKCGKVGHICIDCPAELIFETGQRCDAPVGTMLSCPIYPLFKLDQIVRHQGQGSSPGAPIRLI